MAVALLQENASAMVDGRVFIVSTTLVQTTVLVTVPARKLVTVSVTQVSADLLVNLLFVQDVIMETAWLLVSVCVMRVTKDTPAIKPSVKMIALE